jgi:Ca2+-binding EF-hand superfamily protein
MGAKGSKKKNPAELTEDEINLLLANTSFTREEILKWHEGFIKDCPKG